MDKHIINITVEGGVIQSIENIPHNIQVVVRDYDVEGVDEEALNRDEDDQLFAESLWEDV
jgi:hypothetical protein